MIFQKGTKSTSSATWKRYALWGAIAAATVGVGVAILATGFALIGAAPALSLGLVYVSVFPLALGIVIGIEHCPNI